MCGVKRAQRKKGAKECQETSPIQQEQEKLAPFKTAGNRSKREDVDIFIADKIENAKKIFFHG